jgi:hypothetical protein
LGMEGGFSLLQRKTSLLSSLFRRCGWIGRLWGMSGIGRLGVSLYWNGGEMGIVPMLLRRRTFAAVFEKWYGKGG